MKKETINKDTNLANTGNGVNLANSGNGVDLSGNSADIIIESII